MQRVSKKELEEFWATQTIPRVNAFLDEHEGRNDIWRIALAEASKVDGLYCDFGSGTHTTPIIASMIPDKILYASDSFEGLKYESFSDNHTIGMWVEPNAEEFLSQIPNIRIIKGWYQETVDKFFTEHQEKIAFIHLDCVLESATDCIFHTIFEKQKLQVGSIIQFNNIFYYENDYWYNSDFLLFNKYLKEYNIEVKYLCWAGFCHCAYKVTKV